MRRIAEADVVMLDRSESESTAVVDASDLGFRPGEWPSGFEVVGPNGQLFHRARVVMDVAEDEVLYGLYRSEDHRFFIKVLND